MWKMYSTCFLFLFLKLVMIYTSNFKDFIEVIWHVVYMITSRLIVNNLTLIKKKNYTSNKMLYGISNNINCML